MSCFLLDIGHIRLLTEAVFRYEVPLPTAMEPEDVGQTLLDMNYASYNARYGEQELPPRYTHERGTILMEDRRNAVRLGTVRDLVSYQFFVYKQVCCYAYQSCDTKRWKGSLAQRITEALETILLEISQLSSEAAHKDPDYTAAPWGVVAA